VGKAPPVGVKVIVRKVPAAANSAVKVPREKLLNCIIIKNIA